MLCIWGPDFGSSDGPAGGRNFQGPKYRPVPLGVQPFILICSLFCLCCQRAFRIRQVRWRCAASSRQRRHLLYASRDAQLQPLGEIFFMSECSKTQYPIGHMRQISVTPSFGFRHVSIVLQVISCNTCLYFAPRCSLFVLLCEQ